MRLIQQSQTAQPLVFMLVLSSDHVSAATGLSPTVTLSKNGGAFAACAGAVTEIANGWYKVAGNATDTGTLGPLVLHASVATADPSDVYFDVVAFNPQDSVRIGLTSLPNAAAGASSGLPLAVDSSGRVDVLKINGTSQTARDIGASVLLSIGTGTGQLSITSGVVSANSTQFAGQTITAAAGVTIPASIASPTNITAGTITTATNLTNSATAGDLTAAMQATISGIVASSVSGSVPSAAQNAAAVLTSTSNLTTSGSIGYILAHQVSGAFTSSSSSVLSTAALANAPTGGGTAPTVEEIDTQLSGTHGSGAWGAITSGLSGAFSVTLTFVDATAAPVPGVEFVVMSGASALGAVRASGSGVATFGLNSGSYTIVSAPISGVMWSNASLTVSATTTQTITGTSNQITPPSNPELCAAQGYLIGADGSPLVGAAVVFTLSAVGPVITSSGQAVASTFTVLTDSTGKFSATPVRNDSISDPAQSHWRVTCSAVPSFQKSFVVTTSTLNITAP